jgi:hypothetical protein
MANNLTAGNIEVWSRELQKQRDKKLIALDLCNYLFQDSLKEGDTFHKPYGSRYFVENYTKGTDIANRQDMVQTDETGAVDQIECVPAYLDDVDEIQNHFSLMRTEATKMAYALKKRMDAVVLEQAVSAAGFDIDDADFAGTSGNAHTFTTSDIDQMFTVLNKKLNLTNEELEGRYIVIGPSQLQLLQDMLSAKNTSFGDSVGMTGKVGMRFGVEVYVSNNLTFTARWTPANQPSNSDTITIAGVVINFNTSTPAAAGDCYSETSTAVTIDNLVALLNNSASTAANTIASTSKYWNFTQANLVKLDSLVATDGTTYLDIECVGMGEVVVSGSDATDVWSKHTLHCVGGRKGATSMVIQRKPGLKVVDDPDRIGVNITPWQLYGLKTFAGEDKYSLVDINVNASAFTASSSV